MNHFSRHLFSIIKKQIGFRFPVPVSSSDSGFRIPDSGFRVLGLPTILLSKLGCSVAFGGRNKANLDNVAANCVETRSDAQVTLARLDFP